MGNFVFGGMEYTVIQRNVLVGMDYYHILKNAVTGDVLYLYCYPGS